MPRPRLPLLFSRDSIPELSHVPREERETFWAAAVKAQRIGWVLWASCGAIGAIYAATGSSRDHSPFWSASTLWHLLIAGACGLVGGIVLVNVMYRWVRTRLRAGLAAAGRCPTCGYDLRASPERCPECGTATAKPTSDL